MNSYLSELDLANFVRTSMLLRNFAQAEQNRRNMQRKLSKQTAEIKRLTDELQRVRDLAKSRGDLIMLVQRRAMERQVEKP